jgi:NADH dehydrogenase FAD-containing subunit
MSHIVIIGGGFAGVWSAAAAARMRGSGKDLRITLVAPDETSCCGPGCTSWTRKGLGSS